MIENDESNSCLFLATTLFKPKQELILEYYYDAIARYKIITPFVDEVDMDVLALIIVSFILDNLCERRLDIREIVKKEVFIYPTNQYGLTNITGAVFKKDGLIFDGKGYYYNIFTNKTIIETFDRTVGFAKIILEEAGQCDILYRLDERLSIPASEFYDYTGVPFAKFRSPQFHFKKSDLDHKKAIIVHIDETTLDKLLIVIKQDMDQNTKEEFWHVEIETLPYKDEIEDYVITTFLHGIYYPEREVFTHIDYTKNQYDYQVYAVKYSDCQQGMPIDQYTETKDLHYKIWCIENGAFSKETWYKLMIVSLSETFRKLFDEALA